MTKNNLDIDETGSLLSAVEKMEVYRQQYENEIKKQEQERIWAFIDRISNNGGGDLGCSLGELEDFIFKGEVSDSLKRQYQDLTL